MKTKPNHNNIYAILAMLGLLAISFGLDRLILETKDYVTQYFKGGMIMLLLYPFSTLVLAAGGLLLFWFTTCRMKKSYLLSTIFIIIGILVDLLVFSFVTPLGPSLLFLQPFLLPTSNLFLAAAFTTMIGILSFVLPHPKED